MKAEQLKYRNKIISQYDRKFMTPYENYSEGSFAISVFSFIAAGLVFFYGITANNSIYIGAGFSLALTGLTFVFLTAIFKLLRQIKELNKIILFKMGDHIEKEEKP
ncbi:MAG: hypothetical protein HBSAPP04_18410 [Ignavibacteriaceae bacterium]|nr:MAG: hypothetical protein HBSAPP04_18410 [Ignavibacteriaceae bacterium]